MRSRLTFFVGSVQSILFLGHWFLYVTAAHFFGSPATSPMFKIALAALSLTFVPSSLLAWYSHRPLARLFYTVAAVWLGLASYFTWAAVLCWIVARATGVMGLGWAPRSIALVLFGAALAAGLYALINAAWLRVTRVSIALPDLPEQWRNRVAALVSDVHLGAVRGPRFIEGLARKLMALKPDIIFLAGDIYDGAAADFEKLARPWADLTAEHSPPAIPLGIYSVAGNHEQVYQHSEYREPLLRAGVRELNNEKIEVDGLQVIGVHHDAAVHPDRYRSILRDSGLDRARASVLLLHAPVHLEVAEAEGISLQLSGHTHGGQFFPYTWVARQVWGKMLHGLRQSGSLRVYINYGAGTWGPPMRLGTWPEIVLIRFEQGSQRSSLPQ